MNERILITGGAGFIGSRTANELSRAGYDVRVLDNLDPQVHLEGTGTPLLLDEDIEFVCGDIRDADAVARALEGIDVVYHFAALTGVTQSMFEVERYIDVNVRGTATLWDVIINRNVPLQRFILASSRAVYGEGAYHCVWCAGVVFPETRNLDRLSHAQWETICPQCGQTADPVPTREDKPLRPLSVYAQSKLFQEQICRSLAVSREIPVVILRYFNVYGPHQSLTNPYTGIAATFCSRVLAKNSIPLYEDGLAIRDFVHINDVVTANRLALVGGEKEIAVNIGSGSKASILDLAGMICDVLGSPGNWEITGQYRLGDVRSCYADTRAALRELHFWPRVELREGLTDLV
ncbi:MAG: NAD-dependent epimerase/dehydratase family protein, partial [Acidobacteriota bacterium]